MELKLINDIEDIKNFFDCVVIEYKDDKYVKYDDKRIEEESNDLIKEKTTLYGFFDNGVLVAYLTLRDEGNKVVCFHDVFVKKEFRNKGYGKILIEKGIKFAKTQGYLKVVLASRRGKEEFYKKCNLNGQGLLQADVDKFDRSTIEQFLLKNNIKNFKYKLWNKTVHQFYLNLNQIPNIEEFMANVDKIKLSFNIVFSKKI